ncbi:DNA recombination protein RmuC [methane-oxidizing endosymbiont of Gigantopelta aegis]|uniref:DNA recombination protein RmuC n=1 Tax=methane-oxidizing endosymbiont of Gigantopelta aegis TaxID=2794938 RepID=UPI001FD8DE7D|nr:DNA recombination protein RmuC [methane-oxidizing endosymbiont of Gigantopelta aegis]
MESWNQLWPLLAAVLAGFVVAGIVFLYAMRRQQQQLTALNQQLEQQRKIAQESEVQQAIYQEKLKGQQQIADELSTVQQQLRVSQTENAELKTRLQEQLKNHQQQVELLQSAEQHLKHQFENLAQRIFEQRSKEFSEQNKTSIEHLLTPLRQQFGEFKSRLETLYDSESKDRISLREEIVQLRRDTAKMNQEALNLTRALKGDKKIQGNWGEMVLEKVLEQSGLRKGVEYETQTALRDNDNKLFKPDVIVRLPEEKDVVIDSKVSLLDYERYCSTDDDDERVAALKAHVEAVRAHIKTLSGKDYSHLKGLRSLDFVLLFMPIEAAFMAAFQADEKLFNDAFEHKIVVVTPTTLLATLRTVQNIWRYERQNENARLIADRAGALYDKLCGFAEDLERLGNQLATVNKTYDDAMNKLTHGRGNLIAQAIKFEELGVKVKKKLSKTLTERASLSDE